MSRLLRIIVYLLLPSAIFAGDYNGYYFDSSCALLQPAILSSYQLALKEAQAAIELHDNNNPEFVKLQDYLLPFKQDKIDDAIQRFKKVIEIFSEEQTGGRYGRCENTVVIACDKKRFKDKTEKINNQVVIRHYDGDMDVDWPHNDPSYNQCFGSGFFGVPAVTLQYTKERLVCADVIQLCPWYLTLTFGQKYSQSKSIAPGWLVNIPLSVKQELEKQKQSKTEMDLFTTLDRYLLKHLLLTYSASPEPSPNTAAGMAQNTGVDGWKEAVQAASEKGNTEAENLSWLGVGAFMIQEGKFMPNADGDIVPIPGTTKRFGLSDVGIFAPDNRSMSFDESE